MYFCCFWNYNYYFKHLIGICGMKENMAAESIETPSNPGRREKIILMGNTWCLQALKSLDCFIYLTNKYLIPSVCTKHMSTLGKNDNILSGCSQFNGEGFLEDHLENTTYLYT